MADDNVAYRAIKYRVYPTDAQCEKLSQTFGCVRKVYNDALSLQNGLYEADMPNRTERLLQPSLEERVFFPYGSGQVRSYQ